MVAAEILAFYRDAALSINLNLAHKRSQGVVDAVSKLNTDNGNQAAAMIDRIERLLETK